MKAHDRQRKAECIQSQVFPRQELIGSAAGTSLAADVRDLKASLFGRERRKSLDFNGQESLLLVQRKSEQAMLTPLTPIRRRSPCETAQDSKHLLQQLEYLADIVTVSNSKPPGIEQLILRSL